MDLFPAKELKLGWNITIGLFRASGWCIATLFRGLRAFWRLTRLALRWNDIVGEALECPRGHVTPVYGVYECSCGALHEGWAFSRCVVCGQTAGWTPCTQCGLPVRNPLL